MALTTAVSSRSLRSLSAPGVSGGSGFIRAVFMMPERTKSIANPPGFDGSFRYPGFRAVKSSVSFFGSAVMDKNRTVEGDLGADDLTFAAMRYSVLPALTRI